MTARPAPVLTALCAGLFLLWLLGFSYIPWADTNMYALLGESLMNGQGYSLLGEPHAKYLPLHAVFSIPFVKIVGWYGGMKASSLLAGGLTLIATYALLTRAFSQTIALGTTAALLLHPAFLLLAINGGSDLLFSALFLLAVTSYDRAEENPRQYLTAGVLTGLACLARYNGLPLFAFFFLFTLWKRRSHLRSAWLWGGGLAGIMLFSVWLLRNWFAFGDPLFTSYDDELAENGGMLSQILPNLRYYLHPLQNIQLWLPFALLGLWQPSSKRALLVCAMLTAWTLTLLWGTQGMRFAFAGYPILLGFAVFGFSHAISHVPTRVRPLVKHAALACILLGQASAVCLYAYGACNAWADRMFGLQPSYLGITTEGIHAWNQARMAINTLAEPNAFVRIADTHDRAVWQRTALFRADLHLTDEAAACPLYRIDTHAKPDERILFTTTAEPRTHVLLRACRKP